MNTFLHEVCEWLYSIVIALAIAMVIHIFFFQPTRVSGESMMPTLKNGEYLIVSKWSHVMGEVPNYGDIVIIDSRVQYPRTWKDDVAEPMNNYLAFFDHDLQTKNVWVKRVIGRPGDTLAFHDGKVWRNGEPLDEPISTVLWNTAVGKKLKSRKATYSAWVITETTAVTAVLSVLFLSITCWAALFGNRSLRQLYTTVRNPSCR